MGSYRYTSAEREDMTLERAQELAGKAGFTKEERAELLNTARLLKLRTPTKASCSSCWSDLAVQIVIRLRALTPDLPQEPETAAPQEGETESESESEDKTEKEPRMRLRPGTDVYFRGYRVNGETVRTQEMFRKLLALGFPQKYILTD